MVINKILKSDLVYKVLPRILLIGIIEAGLIDHSIFIVLIVSAVVIILTFSKKISISPHTHQPFKSLGDISSRNTQIPYTDVTDFIRNPIHNSSPISSFHQHDISPIRSSIDHRF